MIRIPALMLSMSALLIAGNVSAQSNYPEKPIRLIVGFPPGSLADAVARVLGQKLAERLGKPIVVDNATGAAGNIATERVAKAAPDGYTLGLLTQTQVDINHSLYKVAYDPVRDFAPVSQVTVSPNILVVHNAVPVKNFLELIKLARAWPGDLTFASSGSGSAPHMAAELFKSAAGVDIRHIPYKGGTAAIPDLLGGRVTMMFSTNVVALPLVRERKLRALAVTSLRRAPGFPELPTIHESGFPGFDYVLWTGLLAPTGTPATIVRKLHLETVTALALPELRAKFADLGQEGIGNSPDEFAAVIKAEIPKWAKLIKDSGIKTD